MKFREIIQQIIKGDLTGHDFHGNQWIDGKGNFNPKGGKGRGEKAKPVARPRPVAARKPKPPVVRQVKPAKPAAPTPIVAKPPVVLQPATPPVAETPKPDPDYNPKVQGEQGNFKKLATNEIAGDAKPFTAGAGGNQQKSVYTVTMKDGSSGLVKEINDWGEFSAERLARNEVLASKIGEALNVPIRSALPVPGQPDAVVQTLLDGTTPKALGCQNVEPFAVASQMAGVPENVQRQIGEIKFFNTLVGNQDDHYKNWIIDGATPGASWSDNPSRGAAAVLGPNAKITGIDYSLAFEAGMPLASDLRYAASAWKIPDERIGGMMQGFKNLLDSGSLRIAKDAEKVQTIYDRLRSAFPDIQPLAKAVGDQTLYIHSIVRPEDGVRGTIENHVGALAYTGVGYGFASEIKAKLQFLGLDSSDAAVWNKLCAGYSDGVLYANTAQ
jgi:hypothetical protein